MSWTSILTSVIGTIIGGGILLLIVAFIMGRNATEQAPYMSPDRQVFDILSKKYPVDGNGELKEVPVIPQPGSDDYENTDSLRS